MLMVLDEFFDTSSTNHYSLEYLKHRKSKMHQIEIRFKGRINPQWSEWFGGLTICHIEGDEMVLTGNVEDQAALYGIISHLRDLGLQLISVSSMEIRENSHEHKK
jgi:hypothetical protein